MKINKYNKPKDANTVLNGNYSSNRTYASGSANSATTAENAGTATKLSTVRNIWGQPFDGTADVDGDMTLHGDIYVETYQDPETDEELGGNVYAKNIEADTGDLTTLKSNTVNATNVTATNKIKGKYVEATTEVSTPLITATNGNIDTVKSKLVDTEKLNVSISAYIKELLATDITCDNLTVTKAAHFFKLIIDEIKASKGQIIVTPGNATLDLVETISGGYRCYFRSKDADGKQINPSIEKNDQVICQTFNAATGTSYNVSNTYYWRLCTNVGTSVVTKTINGQNVECWYFDLSDTDKDKNSNSAPKAGDEVVQLGNRSDTSRQSAIIISAYNNTYLDSELKSPSIVQYDGIKTFELKPYRVNVISKGYNIFKGTFTATNGKDIEDLIDDVDKKADEYTDTYLHLAWANSADGSTNFTKTNNGGDYLYIGMKSDFTESDATLTYKDYKWSRLKGNTGTSVSITSKSVTYQVSDSGTTVPTGTWKTSVPSTSAGQYLWTKTYVKYSDGTETTSYSVSRNGNNGTGVTITEKSVTYQASTSGTTVPTGTWQNDIPSVSKGQYLWTKTYIKYSDGTETTAYSVSYFSTNGNDAEYYTISPVIEKAIVDKNGTLGVQFQYQIIHVKGSTTETVTASKSGYWVRVKPDNSSTYYECSVSTTSPTYTNTTFLKDYHKATSKPVYFTAYLVYGTGATVKDRSTIPVIFDAAATLTITDNITSTVQGYKNDLDDLSGTVSNHTSSISTIQQNYNSIKSTVDSHTTSINNLTGNISDLQDDYSELEQTAKSLSSTITSHTTTINNLNNTVNSHTTSISSLTQTSNSLSSRITTINGRIDIKNYFGFNRGIQAYNTNCMLYPYGYGLIGWGNINRIYKMGITDTTVSDWTLSFKIKATSTITVYPQFCDIAPDYIYRGTVETTNSYINVTTTETKYTCLFGDVTSSYINDGYYNGFIDFECNTNSSGGTTIIVSEICLTKGYKSDVEFVKAEEDMTYTGSRQPFEWNYNTSTITTDLTDFRGLSVYKSTVKPTSTNTYYDLIRYPNLTIKDQTPYTLSFWARADKKNVTIRHYMYNSSWNLHVDKGSATNNGADGYWLTKLSTDWTHYVVHWFPHLNTLSGVAAQKYIKEIIPCRLVYDTSTNNSSAVVYLAGVTFQEGWVEDAQTTNSSLIQQTADAITLKVQNCGIDINSEKIILGGDTDINGTLTLADSGQGFVLQGADGSTIISPQSIGSYSSFQSKSVQNLIYSKQNNFNVGGAIYGSSTTVTINGNFTHNLGTVKTGKLITIKNQSVSFRKYNSGSIITPNTCKVEYIVYQGGTQVATYNTSSATSTTVGSFTTTATAEIKIVSKVTATVNTSTLTNLDATTVVVSMYYNASIPTDAFTLIGYDGIGMNFGTQNTVYFGAEGAYLKYGSHALKVSSSGVQKLDPNGSGNYVNLSNVKITRLTTSTDYTVQSDDEFIVYSGTSSDITVTLPTPSLNTGRRIYFKDKSDGRAFKLSGYLTGTNSPNSSSTTYTVNNGSVFAVCDGLSWVLYNCN